MGVENDGGRGRVPASDDGSDPAHAPAPRDPAPARLGTDDWSENSSQATFGAKWDGATTLVNDRAATEVAVVTLDGPAGPGGEEPSDRMPRSSQARPERPWEGEETLPPWINGVARELTPPSHHEVRLTSAFSDAADAGTAADPPGESAVARSPALPVAAPVAAAKRTGAAGLPLQARPAPASPLPASPRRGPSWTLTLGLALLTGAAGSAAGWFGALSATDATSEARARVGKRGVSAAAAEHVIATRAPVDPVADGGSARLAPIDAGGDRGVASITLRDAGAEVVAPPAETCRLAVTSTPPGAEVALGGERRGVTPVELEAPCGASRVAVQRARYQPVEQDVVLRRGVVARVEVELVRPLHRLSVSSRPPGADVSIEGHIAGKTPLTVEVPGFQAIDVEISLVGFVPVRRTLNLRGPRKLLKVELALE